MSAGTIPLNVLVQVHEALKLASAALVHNPDTLELAMRVANLEGSLGYYVNRMTKSVQVEVSEPAP